MTPTPTTPQKPQKPQRIVWVDILRFIAILMVIAIHSADPFNVSPEARANPEFNYWGSIYGSMLRACVPLFVMITGFLVPISLKIPVTAVIAFAISWALVAVVYRWAPRVARVVFG